MKNVRSLELLSLLPQRPAEFFDRVSGALVSRLVPRSDRKPEYTLAEWPVVLSHLGGLLGSDLTSILAEPALGDVAIEVRANQDRIPPDAPFGLFNNGDFALARLCYAVIRALRPGVVVETGVCYGVTSSFMLCALEQNGSGTLYSIDLPFLVKDADRYTGCLVPDRLRKRWRLSRGASKRLLPKIARGAVPVNFFLHDGLHTYRNMRREFEVVTRNLSRPGVIITDDADWNTAFPEWVATSRPDYWATLAEESKENVLGVAVFGQVPSAKSC